MKNAILFVIAIAVASCSVQKRLYRPGFYVHRPGPSSASEQVGTARKGINPLVLHDRSTPLVTASAGIAEIRDFRPVESVHMVQTTEGTPRIRVSAFSKPHVVKDLRPACVQEADHKAASPEKDVDSQTLVWGLVAVFLSIFAVAVYLILSLLNYV